MVSTVAYLAIFLMLHGLVGAQIANLLALLLTAFGNTAANRRFPFGMHGRGGSGRHQIEGLVVFGIALGITSGALGALHSMVGRPLSCRGTNRARVGESRRDRRQIRPPARLGLSPPPQQLSPGTHYRTRRSR